MVRELGNVARSVVIVGAVSIGVLTTPSAVASVSAPASAAIVSRAAATHVFADGLRLHQNEDPPITLADGRNLSDCISALPKPGCRTRNDVDGRQVATLGALVAGLGFIGWRISRTIRKARPRPTPVER